MGTVPDSLLQYLYSLTSGPSSSGSVSNPVSASLNPPLAPPSALDLPLNISAQQLPDPFVEVANMSTNNSQPQSPMNFLQNVMGLLNPVTTQGSTLPQQQNATTVVPAPVSAAGPDLGGFGQFFLNTTAAPVLPTTNGVIVDAPTLDPNQNNNLWSVAGNSGGSPSNVGAAGSDPYAGGTPAPAAPSVQMPMPVVNRGPMGLNLDAVNAIGMKPPAPSSWGQQPLPSLLPQPPPQQPQPHHQEAPVSNAIIPPEIQMAASNLGRRMGITQHYESHGCVDPTAAAPPGAQGPGLMFSCHHPQSEHTCEAAGVLAGGSVSNMASIMSAMSPGFQQTLEECLSHQTLNKVISEMSSNRNGGRGMNPLLLASLMGSGGGENMMMTMAMMNAMQRKTPAAAPMPAGQQQAPRGLLETYGNPGQATGSVGHSSVTQRCMMVLTQVLGADGGLLSPEAVELIADKRKQMLPYSCQDITAGFMPFRMCCPGKGEGNVCVNKCNDSS